MNIQYISDIHLEFHDKQNKGSISPEMFIKPVASYLALVGDIGIPELASYKVFLTWCSQHWKQVFLVAGNHEFYNVRCPIKSDMTSKKEAIRFICGGLPNVHFLDCSSVYLPEENLRILGCTFWSDIPDGIKEKAILYMNDAKQILHQKDIPLTPWLFSELHEKEKQWLNQEIHTCELANERCLILTHYLPSYSLIHEKYQGHFLNACFASNSDDLFRPPVVGWICGHTHTGMKRQIHVIPCDLYPFGYPAVDFETRDRIAVLKV
jgi:hypothetical protein